jgi:hypothetical protein
MSLLTSTFALAQDDAPYLYYYSRMLGGLIIEHPDGSDSRLIGADVIPAELTGIGGPGWSPSGKYFAASRYVGQDGDSSPALYLMDSKGQPVNEWLNGLRSGWMEWSPTGEDFILIVGTTIAYADRTGLQPYSFWIVNVSTGQILTEYIGYFSTVTFELSRVIWETRQKRIRFFIHPDTYDYSRYYQIIMQFDGTVTKEPATQEEFSEYYISPSVFSGYEPHDAYRISSTGTYEASGLGENQLRNLITGEVVKLPSHSLGTICHDYLWSPKEEYILTLSGTAASDGCGWSAIGITNSQGSLWRELGNSLWDDASVGWLPDRVNVSNLPPGQPEPVLLDPISYEPDNIMWGIYEENLPEIRLVCDGELIRITDGETGNTLFQLDGSQTDECLNHSSSDEIGRKTPIAYAPQHELLATSFDSYVTIWSTRSNPAVPVLRLNTYGYELEFTPDGSQLRARNLNAWKIYDVASILAYARLSD